MDDSLTIWQHCLRCAAKSDVGLRRANNQDAVSVVLADSQASWERRGHVLLVADGMGAHAAGELASKIAADVVPLTYHKLGHLVPPDALMTAVLDANSQIHARGQGDAAFKGMGTTCTVMTLLPEGAMVAHVGDSRAYRLRGDRLEQLTFDHSLVWELRHSGQLPDDMVPNFVSKNIITRSLGPNQAVQVDLEGPFPLEAGDTYLLCTDGLSGQVADEELGAVMACLPPDEAVEALVHLANLRGGPDNITVIVAQVVGPQVAQPSQTDSHPASAAGRPRPVHPLLWTLLGVFAIGAVGLFALQLHLPAVISAAAAAVTGLFALVQRYATGEPEMRFGYRPFGKGPHVALQCVPNASFVKTLVDLVDQLREAGESQSWNIDWDAFNRLLGEGESAKASGDHRRAGGQYLRAISLVMSQIRRRPGSDQGSVLDL